ncbi:MAG TPA: 50S ribosomal protein L30 [Candidatus Limnocylindria bacterium]
MAARQRARPSGPLIRVTWAHSTIGHNAAARGTIRALGLHRLNQTVEVADTPETRGMLRRVAFLLDVQEPAGRGTTSDEDSK